MAAIFQTTFSNAFGKIQAIIRTNDGYFIDAYIRHSASMSQLIEAEWRIYMYVSVN